MTTHTGTHIDVPFVEVIDGDTIKVELPGDKIESIRILCLDTEEKPGSGGNKPKTPWGEEATNRATEFFAGAQHATLEFPGNEPAEVCLAKYRGNFGRVLAFVYLDGVDFQEVMIREGYSPYFTKYGNAKFKVNHDRYIQAEREAQMAHIGVWNQIEVNGEVRRDYPTLSTWWTLRGNLIDAYRTHLAAGKTIYNTRLDYAEIVAKAQQGKTAPVFTEVRNLRTIHNDSIGFIDIGSQTQRFTLFLPGLNSLEGVKLKNLLEQRYIATGNDSSQPRRSYLYVTGELSLYNDDPQMKVTNVDQITDDFADELTVPRPRPTAPGAKIVAILPNPAGRDAGRETVTVKNTSTAALSLQGWTLGDKAENEMSLNAITLVPGATEEITVQGSLSLNNKGDEVTLRDADGNEIDKVSYGSDDVISGQPIFF